MFIGSALLYAIRLALARRSLSEVDNRAVQAVDRPANTQDTAA
jgi:hypothetical protein